MANKAATLTVMVLVFVLAGCTSVSKEGDCGIGSGCARQAPRTDQQPPRQEPTVYPRQVLTGVITDEGAGRILVEKDPDAGCQRDKAPMGPCSPKMWFSIEKSTRVLWEGGGDRSANATDLKEGQRVIGDYTGYDVAESYPSQTSARTVTILGRH